MSTSSRVAQLGDVLTFRSDASLEESEKRLPVYVTWHQSLKTHSEPYYDILAENETAGNGTVRLYIQASIYENLNTVAEVEGPLVKITITNKFQYGQIDAGLLGKARFVVLQDKDRKPFQQSFVKTTLAEQGASAFTELAEAIGLGDIAEYIHSFIEDVTADHLKDF